VEGLFHLAFYRLRGTEGHLTKEGLEQIQAIKMRMNKGRTVVSKKT